MSIEKKTLSELFILIDNTPQKMSGTITKHVVVIGELSTQVSKQQLLEISELEQEISCRADHSAQLQVIFNFYTYLHR